MTSNIRPTLHHNQLQGVNDAAFSQIWVLWHRSRFIWLLGLDFKCGVLLNCIHPAYVEMCGGDVASSKYVATTAYCSKFQIPSYFKPGKIFFFSAVGGKDTFQNVLCLPCDGWQTRSTQGLNTAACPRPYWIWTLMPWSCSQHHAISSFISVSQQQRETWGTPAQRTYKRNLGQSSFWFG